MGFLSVKEVAQILNKSEQYIRKLLRQGRLPGEKVGKQWVVFEEALEQANSEKNVVTGVPDHPKKESYSPDVIALSFFSGAMGLDHGLEKAGISVILASEIDPKCRETIQKNRPEIALIGDIRDYSANEIRTAAGLEKFDDIDLVVGGPPCQAFSTAGKRMGLVDERGNVFLVFVDRILELRPKYAVIENVRGLLSAPLSHRPHNKRGFGYPPLTPEEEKGGALHYIMGKLEDGGYSVSFNLYNAANFGSPQKRERVIMVCSRDGSRAPFLVPTHSETGLFDLPKWRTFHDVVKDLDPNGHEHVNFPEKRLKYYRMIGAGQYWRHLPEEFQKEALGASFYANGGKTGFIRRLAWDKPSPTLVTNPTMPATDLAHPEEDRPLSVQEYKRIQEFPDGWDIFGSVLDKYRQIGNAVPGSLGKAVGKLIVSLMKKEDIKQYKKFPYSRYKNTDDLSFRLMMLERLETAPEQLELYFEAES